MKIRRIDINFAFGLLANRKGFEWWRLVKQPRALSALLLRVMHLTVGHISSMWVTTLYHVVRDLVRLANRQGAKGLVKYLKVLYIITQQVAGGYKVNDLGTLGCRVSRTRRGLPRIINKAHRREIMLGNHMVLRTYLTIFGLYRVIPFKGVVKLGTITGLSSYKQSDYFGHKAFVAIFWTKVWSIVTRANVVRTSCVSSLIARKGLGYKDERSEKPTLRPDRLLPITSAGPLSSGAGYEAFGPTPLWFKITEKMNTRHRLCQDGVGFLPGLWRGLRPSEIELKARFDKAWKGLSPSSVGTLFFTVSNWMNSGLLPFLIEWVKLYDVRVVKDLFKAAYTVDFCHLEGWGQKGNLFGLGKLAFLEEAAGKVRVVALVDVVTQSILKPLHDWIFSILSKIPQDGTFDQNSPVLLIQKLGRKEVYSYDLSAATDRLPLALQSALLGWILGEKVATLWETLLVGRKYSFSARTAEKYGLNTTDVQYAAGQPMGAYSSWAMLALTHHFCVQLAASRAHGLWCPWFDSYAVLGDDIVIADGAVAKQYLELMRSLGVTIQETKSLVSNNGTFEFAKRTVVRGVDATPVSLKGFLAGLNNIACLESILAKVPEIWENKLPQVVRSLGYGYKTLGRLQSILATNSRLQGLFIFLKRPNGLLGSLTYSSWLSMISPRIAGAPLTDESVKKIYQFIGDWALERLTKQVKARLGAFERTAGAGWVPTSLFPTRALFDLYQRLVLRHVGLDIKSRLTELEVLLLQWKGQAEVGLDQFNELMKDLDRILGALDGLPKDAKVAKLSPDGGKIVKSNIFGYWRKLRALVVRH